MCGKKRLGVARHKGRFSLKTNLPSQKARSWGGGHGLHHNGGTMGERIFEEGGAKMKVKNT